MLSARRMQWVSQNLACCPRTTRGTFNLLFCVPFIGQTSVRGLRLFSASSIPKHGSSGKREERINLKEGTEANEEAALLERALLPQQQILLRCTEIDSKGNVTQISGPFKKHELCSMHGLQPRDLRKIDSPVHPLLPQILVRSKCILLKILHIRALIKHDTVLLFDGYGSTDTHIRSVFMYDLAGRLGSSKEGKGGLPYELRAVEACLISVFSALESEFGVLRQLVSTTLIGLEEDVDRDKLRQLLQYSRKLTEFATKAALVRQAIDNILESDEDLSGMYLSSIHNGATEGTDDADELEMLLESYEYEAEEIVQAANALKSDLKNTEGVVELVLDSNRNSLLALDIKISIGTLGLAAGTGIASLFGMNLMNHLEESSAAFLSITATATILTIAIIGIGIRRLARLRRIHLRGQAVRDLAEQKYLKRAGSRQS